MKKIDQKKIKSNIVSVKNSYCIALGNAGERTQGMPGSRVESTPRGFRSYDLYG